MIKRRGLLLLIFVLIFLTSCKQKEDIEEKEIPKEAIKMKLTSPVFENNGNIPSKYTCDGENINPELVISEVPEGTESFVLIVDDPDVPKEVRPEQMWVHWVVFNIPKETKIIKENSQPGTPGKGDYPHTNYGGPCPPKQYRPTEHRYFFKLYALDVELSLSEGSTKVEVEQAMQGHLLAETQLIGRYERK